MVYPEHIVLVPETSLSTVGFLLSGGFDIDVPFPFIGDTFVTFTGGLEHNYGQSIVIIMKGESFGSNVVKMNAFQKSIFKQVVIRILFSKMCFMIHARNDLSFASNDI